MIRALIGFPLLLILIAAGALYGSYGEIEPCRALAVERARRAEHSIGLPVESGAEHWTRMATSQMSSSDCAKGLLQSWSERVKSALP
jgi:hypothetical protein